MDDLELKDISTYDFLMLRYNLFSETYVNLVEKYDKVIIMDFDCFVRGSLSPVFSILDNADMTLRIKRMSNKGMEFGVIGYKGYKALSFLKEWADINKNILPNLKVDGWFDNQSHFYSLIIKWNKENLFTVESLPSIYETKDLSNQDAIVWHARTKTKQSYLSHFQKSLKNLTTTN